MTIDAVSRRVAPGAAVAGATLLAAAALASAAIPSGSYRGTTSEGGSVTFTVARGGRALRFFRAQLGYNGKCGPGGGPLLNASIPALAIGPGGTFATGTRLRLGTVVNDPGRVSGRISHGVATGTIQQYLHGRPNRCYVEAFSARRR